MTLSNPTAPFAPSNSLLKKQLKRHLPSVDEGNIPEELQELLRAVEQAYDHYEQDRQLLERASDLAADELRAANADLLDLTESLEQRVKERTQHLKLALAKAHQSNKAKSLFLAKMSHELRTPLNAINGFSELLWRLLEKAKASEKLLQYVTRIRQTGNQLNSIIGDILDLSRIEAGKMSLIYEAVDTTPFFQRLHEQYYVVANDKGISFQLEVADDVPEQFMAEPGKLNQVITNLIGNALKFTEAGGKVDLSVKIGADQLLEVAVSDTGIGIPRERQQEVFSPFEQSDNSITRNYGGTGLGLAISRELAQLMRGEITLVSEEGKGSTFTLRIPIKQPIEKQVSEEKTLRKKQTLNRDAHILIVEDNPINQEVIVQFLDLLDMKNVTLANNGKEGLDKARELKPDLVLLDLHMPIMDGFESAKQIRSLNDQAVAEVPIVLLTADAFNKVKRQALGMGINACLTKPLDFDQVTEVLEQFVGIK